MVSGFMDGPVSHHQSNGLSSAGRSAKRLLWIVSGSKARFCLLGAQKELDNASFAMDWIIGRIAVRQHRMFASSHALWIVLQHRSVQQWCVQQWMCDRKLR